MHDAATVRQIKSKYRRLAPVMDERMRREWAASEAEGYGWGGVSAVSSATGMSRLTVAKGLAELSLRVRRPRTAVSARIRRPGAGRKTITETDPGLSSALERPIDPVTRGEPMSPLRWTCLSTRQLAQALREQGHSISPRSIGRLLNAAEYSLQGNRKRQEGASF